MPDPHLPDSQFALERDLDAYCHLRAHLPAGLTVEATPSTAYYSEWKFHYEVKRGEEVLHVLEGDFREIEAGSLVRQAMQILEDAKC